MSATEEMACPKCGKLYARGEYIPRPELANKPLGKVMESNKWPGIRSGTPFCPADVTCECGAILRHTVPIFKTDKYGWHWRIVDWAK